MKLINQILSKNITPIIKLEQILVPFALLATEEVPLFNGNPVESLDISINKNYPEVIFSINGEVLAIVKVMEQEFSIYGEDYIELRNEDMESIDQLITTLMNLAIKA